MMSTKELIIVRLLERVMSMVSVGKSIFGIVVACTLGEIVTVVIILIALLCLLGMDVGWIVKMAEMDLSEARRWVEKLERKGKKGDW